ncbi:MAG TPA: beta-L-arabinofuranosidase domain-containing protein [Ruminiclostridium sp.]
MQKYKSINFTDIDIYKGFWHDRQKTNAETSIYSIWERFKETGRFEAFKFEWKEGMPNKPHIFWDSDFAKWAEAVAYILEKNPNKELEQAVDEIVDLIEKNQEPSGYFNIFFTVAEPGNRWKKRTEHELYCAGHLIEAAVAYQHATGKDKFLKLMCKYADHIENVFVKEKSASFITPGHEEIELALVKLYRCTGEKRYLNLSKFFIDNRGPENTPQEYYPWVNANYSQDNLPARELSVADGHSVRAVYLYSAMADIAYEFDETSLFDACRRLFENIAYKRMYITGGIGSASTGEAFTIDYDLPNLTAYTESCAAIGLALFAKRMLLLDNDSLYSDITERVLYNGFLSSISLDGKAFFYENPLEIDPKLHHRDASIKIGKSRFPITERLEVFECSCCPPNISRFFASIADHLYTYDDNTLFVHHYMNSTTNVSINDNPVKVSQETQYPSDGKIVITVTGFEDKEIALRIPYWCEKYSLCVNGSPAKFDIKKGYAYVKCDIGKCKIDLDFEMKPQLIETIPDVQDNAGRVALQRGPIVYCLEGVDNGSNLREIAIDSALEIRMKFDNKIGTHVLSCKGYRKDMDKRFLYQPVCNNYKEQELRFIPYYAFANRGETEMIVWILKK